MARRGPNEGNIYQRSDGRWVARLNLGYEGSKRRRKHFYAHTRREALEKLDKARRDLQQGLPVGGDARTTVAQFLTGWLEDAARPTVRPRTYQTYESNVRLHLIPALGRIPLQKLQAVDVQRLLIRKLATGLAPQTVHHLRAVLRRALSQAVRWGILARNPAALVDAPRVPRYEVPTMGPDDAQRFLAVIQGDRLEALFTVALAVGLRQGEALGLRWVDVDLDGGTLSVRFALQRLDGRLQLVEPKTKLSRRTLALPDFAVVSLRRHRANQRREQLWAGSRWHDSALVFTSSIGTPLDATNVTHRLQRILAAAGLPRMRFHDLRHGCASLLIAQGVHPRVVMETLGHSQIGLTMNTYGHVLPALQREAAKRMDEILAT